MKIFRISLLLACMLFGMVATRFAPPVLSVIIALTTAVVVAALGRQVVADLRKTADADQLRFRRFEAGSDQKKLIARTVFWIGISIFGVGVGILVTYIGYPEDVSAIPNPLLNGGFLAATGLMIAIFPKFVMFSK